jgi:hypothetical protein
MNNLEQPPKKRLKSSSVDEIIGIQSGQHIEVKWDIVNDEDLSVEEIFWGAKVLNRNETYVLKGDGEKEEQPVYRIEYEAMPSKGFNEKSEANVIFVSDEAIYHVDDDQLLEFRRKKSKDETIENTMNDSELIENMIGSLVSGAVTKHSSKLDALHPNAQVRRSVRVFVSHSQLQNT